jgi:hypothetical protein
VPSSPGADGISRPSERRILAAWLGCLGCLVLTGISVMYALRVPAVTDFVGFDSVLHAARDHLGCVYTRSVQLTGARAVPGLRAPTTPGQLPWHFNEPLLLTLPVFPLLGLPARAALAVWEAASLAALGGCAVLWWRGLRREPGAVPPALAAGVLASLLFNQIANTNLALAQDDAFLLLAFACGLALLRRGRDYGAGLLFGAVALKPQLVFLVLLFLVFQRRWRAAAAMGGTAAALWSASIAMVGPSCAVHWLHTASQVGELKVGVGLPTTLAVLTNTTLPAELLFCLLSALAVVLLWRLRGIGTELGIAVALACALVIGAHVLAYDMLFLAPLGVVLARRYPWAVYGSGWVVSMALIADYLTRWFKAPVHLVEFVPLAVLAAALLAIRPLPAERPIESHLSRIP